MFANELFIHSAGVFRRAQSIEVRAQVAQKISDLGITGRQLRLDGWIVALLLDEALIVFERGLQHFSTDPLRIGVFAQGLTYSSIEIQDIPSLAQILFGLAQ